MKRQQRSIQDLAKRWKEDGETSTIGPPEREEWEERPKVFVSYMSEDSRFAERLVQSLDKNGIDLWFDKQRLKFGDRWDTALEEAIRKEADFFIVLLSKHLADGVETYVHLEVKIALERQSKRGALKFVYPLQIGEEAQRLDALDREKIQASPLEDIDTDVPELAKDIRKQFQKLHRR